MRCLQPCGNTENGTAEGSRGAWEILKPKKKQPVPPHWGPRDCPTTDPPCWVSLLHHTMLVTVPHPSFRMNKPWVLLSSCCRARQQLRTRRCTRAEPFPPTLRANPLFYLFASFTFAFQIWYKTHKQLHATDQGPFASCALHLILSRDYKYTCQRKKKKKRPLSLIF